MTTNLLSVIEQQHKALEALHYDIGTINQQNGIAEAALAAGQQALEQTQGEAVSVDWQDMYWRQKRRAEMWIAKYEKDIGPLEKVHPQATEPAQSSNPPAKHSESSLLDSEPAPNPLDALTKTCEGLGLYEADFEPAPSTAGEQVYADDWVVSNDILSMARATGAEEVIGNWLFYMTGSHLERFAALLQSTALPAKEKS